MESSFPFMYGLQKWLLIRASHTVVTINGKWPNQPGHIHSLENPCFTREEWSLAEAIGRIKKFDAKLVICFAGLVAESKGAPQLIDALLLIPDLDRYVSKVIIAGSGPALDDMRFAADGLSVPVIFKGYLDRSALNVVYEESHILVLPSRTEGFPKVVAEAAAFGCIPVVTDVSSIGQYIKNEKSGFLLSDNSPETIRKVLVRLFSHHGLQAISQMAVSVSSKFTYEQFSRRILEMLSDRRGVLKKRSEIHNGSSEI